jgi:uncharacterized protein (TIGR03083 family)
MENSRFLECLAADEQRLREVAARDLTAQVPPCPEWTVRDLVEHVALVYLHKVECMRHPGPGETDWPPKAEPLPPLELLDHAYATLRDEFDRRPPDSPSGTWYDPDQTAGFWIRRMAQETVIHRVDGELAAGEPIAPIPADLALDGIDEVLEQFLGYGSRKWSEYFGAALAEADGGTVLVSANGRGWLVRMLPTGVEVEPPDPGSTEATAGISGDPQSVLLWLWRRTDASAVTFAGERAALGRLRDLLGTATQ